MGEDYVVVDVETTGLDASKDKIVEVAVAFRRNGNLYYASSLVNPMMPIPIEATSINHITDDHVLTAPQLNHIIDEKGRGFPRGILVAHNAKFDKQFLRIPDRHWLCTMRCSMHLWPDAPNYKNQTIRYYTGISVDLPDGLAPHRALYDTLVTEALLQHMLKMKSLEDLLVLQDRPVLQKKIRFGKYRGHEWKNIPIDYMRWCMRQPDDGGIGEDERYTIRHYLGA